MNPLVTKLNANWVKITGRSLGTMHFLIKLQAIYNTLLYARNLYICLMTILPLITKLYVLSSMRLFPTERQH